MRRLLAAVVLAVLGAAAPGRAQSDCSVLGQNTYVHDTLNEFYLWYKEMPAVSPAAFDSPEALLEAVRYRPLDDTFSYISGKVADQAYYGDSQYVGFGFGMRLLSAGELWVTDVYPGSAAAAVGLQRGHRILALGGVPIGDLYASGQLDAALGPSEIGYSVEVRFVDLQGTETTGTMVKGLVTIPTVGLVRVFDVGGRRVGYVVFKNFVTPSTAALSTAFAELRREGATELILDLRYNGGGLVSVAQHLGGLIGGVNTGSQVFCEFFHNDKNAFRNQTLYFEDPIHALDLRQLVVITTRSSASASELVINALRPFMKVTVVGDSTYGKPVGQYGFTFCDKVLHPVAFSLRNALGQGDFFGGFPPDCPASDDLLHAFGDPAEASLAAALGYLETGTCSAAAAASLRTQSARARGLRQPGAGDPWRELVGAY